LQERLILVGFKPAQIGSCLAVERLLAMKKKTPKKMLGPTLQEFEIVPVTDPAEFAALDRRCRAAEKARAGAERDAGKRKSSKGVDPGPKRG
jgi:hypothetical protein